MCRPLDPRAAVPSHSPAASYPVGVPDIARARISGTVHLNSEPLRHRGIDIRQLSQCGLQRPKPSFVMLPLFIGPLVYGLSDLLGTDGHHSPLVFVEFQAPGIEGQAAIVENAARLTFRVLDQR